MYGTPTQRTPSGHSWRQPRPHMFISLSYSLARTLLLAIQLIPPTDGTNDTNMKQLPPFFSFLLLITVWQPVIWPIDQATLGCRSPALIPSAPLRSAVQCSSTFATT
ncbi:hypothetical protein LY78DRAFT_126870 [Colletotrichum sublineola]|nr:hypothetical protein LY78DRAFT_126870 [Colletotrichum sublineola]